MTTFLRRASPKHPIRETDNQSAWLLDSKNKIIFFENLQNQNSIKTPLVRYHMFNNSQSIFFSLYYIQYSAEPVESERESNNALRFDWHAH